MSAHPADLSGGVADNEAVGLYGLGDDGSCADEGISADVVTTDDGGIGADGSTFSDDGFQVFSLAVDSAAGVIDIGEDHRRAEENVVFADDAFVNGYVVLYLDVVSELDAIGHEYVLAEVAVFPDDGSWHYMTEVPYFAAFADGGAGVNNSSRMNKNGGCQDFFCFFWIASKFSKSMVSSPIAIA